MKTIDNDEYKELLDKHWQEKCNHKLNRQKVELKKYFGFEINEAILSLNTDYPDIAMALNRLKHMKEYLEDMKCTQ